MIWTFVLPGAGSWVAASPGGSGEPLVGSTLSGSWGFGGQRCSFYEQHYLYL